MEKEDEMDNSVIVKKLSITSWNVNAMAISKTNSDHKVEVPEHIFQWMEILDCTCWTLACPTVAPNL